MASPDSHANFAYSTVVSAPSPATSGTTLVVATGDGALFPTPPFNATVWPAGAQPLASNSEIVRVTVIATNTLGIVRAQEGSSARTVVVGDQIAATITKKTLTDIEGQAPTVATGLWYSPMGALAPTLVMVENKLYAIPIEFPRAVTIAAIGVEITVVGAASSVIRLGIYDDEAGVPTSLLVDAGTINGTVLFSSTPGQVTGLSTVCGPGRVWLAAVSQAQASTQPTVKAIGMGLVLVPKSIQPGGAGQTNTGYVANGTTTTAALPGTFPASDCGSTIPRVCVST
jgi:hypothetical protein